MNRDQFTEWVLASLRFRSNIETDANRRRTLYLKPRGVNIFDPTKDVITRR